MSLNNLGSCLYQAGRLNDALPTVKEAVALYLDLFQDNPAACPDAADVRQS
ncbi:hypothetical protein ACWF99_11830 [Nocardia sp. NPDC055002]